MKLIATNRKALRDYFILEAVECGIELKGSEVKSLRDGRIGLNDAFARLEKDEVLLYNTHISPYEQASYLNVDPLRLRKLLLHKNQIRKLAEKVSQKGFTLIPLKVYFNDRGFVKIELALCRGKKLYDLREDIKHKEAKIQIQRALKRKLK